MKKISTTFLSLLFAGCFALGAAACNDTDDPSADFSFVLSEDGSFYVLQQVQFIKDNTLIFPSSYRDLPVKEIGRQACMRQPELTILVIPDSVCVIGEVAFSACSNLTNVTIGDSVVSIGFRAFDSCPNLTSVVFEEPTEWKDEFGNSVDFSDPSSAATLLKSSYYKYTRIEN